MIVLFVTIEKQNSQAQYNDFIDGEYLFWEGDALRVLELLAHRSDFFWSVHHMPFMYFGEIGLVDCVVSLQALHF